ncbi:MAG: HD domain-containing protein [Elusimicrobiota bacterium]|nr:HD domain-containing protein [Endomicrobiia bacterium]MDW8165423.1 HD domain-containing protein [Elusimicrobiota bacterium]
MKIFDQIKNNKEALTYLKQADENFKALGYTEQGILHAHFTSQQVYKILSSLGFSLEDIDIAMTAGFLHDIGCCISYKNHSQQGTFVANKILSKINISDEEKIKILSIIGSHEDTDLEMFPISELAAAVSIADKTDVRRQRVIKTDFKYFDQYDRVHYAVVDNSLDIIDISKVIRLSIRIDEEICSVLEYFELFLSRINFCRRAAGKLGVNFELYINDVKYL